NRPAHRRLRWLWRAQCAGSHCVASAALRSGGAFVTDRYAVIGNPVAHSLSPRIHAAFALQTGQDIEYGAILAPAGGFAVAVDTFRAQGGRGLNVTVPFKLDAFALSTTLSGRAQSAGAVNTLRFDGDTALGDNTDGAGFVADITIRLDIPLTAKRILLM